MAEYSPTQPTVTNSIQTASLTDVLVDLEKRINLKLNCHAIGTIQSFDATKQSAKVSINYQKAYIAKNADGSYSEKTESYPVLSDVPVIVLSGGSASLTFPISSGDPCLVLFNDRDIDIWASSGQVMPPNSTRTHDLNDGIALVGLRPFSSPLSGYDSTRAVLKNGNAQIGVGSTKIRIQNNTINLQTQLTDLCSRLNSLCSAIQSLTVTCNAVGSPSSPPINAAIFATLSTQISAISSNISGLLE